MAITLQEVGTDGIDGTDTGHPRPPITLILHKIQSCRNLQISSVTENHLLPPQRSDVDSTGDPPAFFC